GGGGGAGGLCPRAAGRAGEDEPLAALHPCRLDEQDAPAGAGDGEPGRDAGDGGALGGLLVEALLAERVSKRRLVDRDRGGELAGRQLRRRLPQRLAELAFALADAGLA